MLNLNRIFENWFADPEFSVTEKLNFAANTRDNLAANNAGGEFDDILPLLDTAVTNAGGKTGTEQVAIAVRIAAVRGKQNLLETIKSTISRRSGRISDTYGKGSVEWLEFFPQGVTPYRQMDETEVEARLDVIIAAATKYVPAMVAEFTTFKTNWLDTKKAAGDRISEVGAANLSQDAAMTQLEILLMKVIFTAGLAFTGNEAMGPALFDQSRLYNPTQPTDPAPPPVNP